MSEKKNKPKIKDQTESTKSEKIKASKEEEEEEEKEEKSKSKRKLNEASEKNIKDNHTAKEASKVSKSELILDVHSANNWEEADLGDENRKMKFLKLMGATKVKKINKLCFFFL
jgi:hypothetical protein